MTTPTPGDLSARHEGDPKSMPADYLLDLAHQLHHRVVNGGSQGPRLDELNAEILRRCAALSALPAGGDSIVVPLEAVSQAAAALDVLGRRDLAAWLMRSLSTTPPADADVGARGEEAQKILADAIRLGVDDAWSRTKPTDPGIYKVRRWQVGRLGLEAVVVADMHDGELRCNLHRETSDSDVQDWPRVARMSDRFEWKRIFDYAALTRQPVAGGGWVERVRAWANTLQSADRTTLHLLLDELATPADTPTDGGEG